ncbi:MAG: hemolysin family protein [Candidatus Riflebacteria bacterium]|nr:hemolysin family protein [Candidatus Riflebacteria bacterium]
MTSLNEITLASSNRTGRLHNIVLWMCRNKGTVISALLVGNNIFNTVLAVYAGVVSDKIFAGNELFSPSMGPVVASFVTIVFLLIFGEVVPKQIGVTFSSKIIYLIAYPIYAVVYLLKPITKAMDLLSILVIKMLPFKPEGTGAPTIQEMLAMAKYSEKAGHIDSMERKLMARSSKFNDIAARNVMVPRNKITGIPVNIDFDNLMAIFKENMYTRVPVYISDIDEIIGVFNFKELLKISKNDISTFSVAKNMIVPLYVPENVAIGELLERMRENCSHMAVVIDEYAATQGIITMEDIVERVFGVINDEYDEDVPQALINEEEKLLKDGKIIVDGSITLQDLSEMLNVRFPVKITRRVNTLNGFLTFVKGDFPREKEKIFFDKYTFTIKEIDSHRVEKVLISKK